MRERMLSVTRVIFCLIWVWSSKLIYTTSLTRLLLAPCVIHPDFYPWLQTSSKIVHKDVRNASMQTRNVFGKLLGTNNIPVNYLSLVLSTQSPLTWNMSVDVEIRPRTAQYNTSKVSAHQLFLSRFRCFPLLCALFLHQWTYFTCAIEREKELQGFFFSCSSHLFFEGSSNCPLQLSDVWPNFESSWLRRFEA